METDLVSATIDEVRSDREIDPDRVRARLVDWQKRVHELFDFFQEALGTEFTYDRSGKQNSREEMVERAALDDEQVPKLDVLRIEKPLGAVRALVVPRGLWIIGANGRLDLRVSYPQSRQYLIVDHSRPLSGRADWQLIAAADRLTEHPLTSELVRGIVGAGL